VNTLKISEPLVSKPLVYEKVWGDENLNRIFSSQSKQKIGEAWLFSFYPGMCNELYGLSTFRVYGKSDEVLRDEISNFPLLLKLISCSEWLSVQVHPNDTIAMELENYERGKTECWYFLKDGGQAMIGKDNSAVAKAVRNENWEDVLEKKTFNFQDILFLPAGTVHTMGPGSMLLEIQQSSDITYRLYDWGRDRPVHKEKGLKVLNSIRSGYVISRNSQAFESPFFRFRKIKDQICEGFGVYVDLKSYKTIVLPSDVSYYFEGEYIEYKR